MTDLLIITDVRLYREGLAHALAQRAGLRVVGAAGSRDDALAQIAELRPRLVLIDMAMRDSFATAQAVVRADEQIRLIALTITEADGDVVACAEAGVAGYVPREASLEDLLAVIESVSRGELCCSPRIAAALQRRLATLAAGNAPSRPRTSNPLTPREREILRLVDDGLSNKAIAARLCIGVATVKNHVHNILEKLELRRRGEAAAWMRAGARPVVRGGAEPGRGWAPPRLSPEIHATAHPSSRPPHEGDTHA